MLRESKFELSNLEGRLPQAKYLSLMAPKLVAALDRLDSPVDSFDRSREAADPSA